MDATPTVPPPQPGSLSTSLRRNIAALEQHRRSEAADASLQERIADGITAFTGSLAFVYIHLLGYGAWILANFGHILGVSAGFDPSFNLLAMEASVEAIFLSTFVLISQNRSSKIASKRADLDLQISLLTEHELTKVATLVSALAERAGISGAAGAEMQEIQKDVAPEAVLDAIEAHRDDI